MVLRAIEQRFHEVFPELKGAGKERVFAVRAPGRVNLIGEHTDYNGGFVCPMAIDREMTIVGVPRGDTKIRMHSTLANQTVAFDASAEIAKDGPPWSLYAKGSVEAMRRRGKVKCGFDCLADSSVPLGGGLSSSASFEVATALATLAANDESLDRVELALACQWAEHTYPGVPCGIMDQFISAMGKKGYAMLLDCRDQSRRYVPLDDPNVKIVISNTNVHHELAAGEYGKRRAQCEAAVAAIQKKHAQVALLRDATMEMLDDARGGGDEMDDVTYRRARHVITEIARTVDFAADLENRDYKRCGERMYSSHTSLRDDYEVSCTELDILVEIARGVQGVYGARMTGGGFGGCIVAIVEATAVEKLTAAIDAEYPKRTGKKATTFATVASAGAGKLEWRPSHVV
ncbi:MAG: galactokinase [Phycisphaerales bacterium]|nr:galactokinase [Phycisphaerales bacterium]